MNVKRRSLGSLVREPIRNGKSAQTDPESKGVRVFTLTAVTKADFGEQNTKRSVLSDDDVQGIWAEPDDIFIQRSNTPELVGTAAIYNGPRAFAVYPDLLTRVRTNDSLRPRYLVLYLRSSWVRQYFQTNARGISGSMPKVSHQTINELPVPVPSLPEQDRIVAAIEAHFSRLDAAEQGLKRVRAKLKHARASVLKAAVEGRLVPTEAALARAEGRSYEPASALLARTPLVPRPNRYASRSTDRIYGHASLAVGDALPSHPEGWASAPLVDVAKMESGHTPSRSHPEWWDGDIPWIGIPDARDHHGGLIHNTSQHTNEDGLANSASRLLPAATVCISRTASVGYVVVMAKPMATSQDFVNWVCSSALNPHWVRMVFLADRQALLRFGKGSVHTTIYFPELLSLHIAIPPLAEQARIVAEVDRRLSVLDQVEALVDRSLSRCASLRQSILKRAFEGRLVPPSAEVTPE